MWGEEFLLIVGKHKWVGKVLPWWGERGERESPHLGKIPENTLTKTNIPPIDENSGGTWSVPLKKKWQKKTEEKISKTYTSDQEKGWEKSHMFKNYLKLIPS